jgi:AcrR family transcriptional regulator
MAAESPPRSLRSDARRNHDRIIVAAREAFAEQGLEVPMEEIARRSGVGPATLYRRFASKQELLRAVLEAGLAELEVPLAAAQEADDPWAGLLAGMATLLAAQAANRALVQALEQAGELAVFKRELAERVFEPLRSLLVRAQAAGVVRQDLDPSELPVLLRMLATTSTPGPTPGPAPCWQRYLALLCDALRTPAPSALPPL